MALPLPFAPIHPLCRMVLHLAEWLLPCKAHKIHPLGPILTPFGRTHAFFPNLLFALASTTFLPQILQFQILHQNLLMEPIHLNSPTSNPPNSHPPQKEKPRRLVKGTKGSKVTKNTPTSSNLAIVPLTEPRSSLAYPHGEIPSFPEEIMRKRYDNFSSRELVPIRVPDVQNLQALGILPELRMLFERVGCEFVFKTNVDVFKDVVVEFVSTFKSHWLMETKDDGTYDKSTAQVDEISFRMGSITYTLSNEEVNKGIRGNFRGGRGELPSMERKRRNEFWKEITNSNDIFKVPKKSSEIVIPIWKFVHKIIATCIYVRPDMGHFVNAEDVEFMLAMKRGKVVDMCTVISNYFEDIQRSIRRTCGIGGGHFVTSLGHKVGYSFLYKHALLNSTLSMKTLRKMGLVKKIKDEWVLIEQQSKEGAEVHHAPEEAYPTREPAPTDLSSIRRDLDGFLTNQALQNKWLHEWATSLSDKMGLATPPHPPPPYLPPHLQHGSQSNPHHSPRFEDNIENQEDDDEDDGVSNSRDDNFSLEELGIDINDYVFKPREEERNTNTNEENVENTARISSDDDDLPLRVVMERSVKARHDH